MRDVLQSVYQEHAKDLFRYGLSICQDKNVVEDAIQDLFLYLHNHYSTFAKAEDPKRYLFVSLRNRIFKTMKKKPVFYAIPPTTASSVETADEKMIIDERTRHEKAMVMEMLSNLSPRQREVIYLRFSEQMSYKEIATLLSIEPQSAQNLFGRAIDKLRSKLLLMRNINDYL